MKLNISSISIWVKLQSCFLSLADHDHLHLLYSPLSTYFKLNHNYQSQKVLDLFSNTMIKLSAHPRQKSFLEGLTLLKISASDSFSKSQSNFSKNVEPVFMASRYSQNFSCVILLMNYSPGRKQSRRTQYDEMTTNQTTNSRVNRSNRSKTEEVYQEYFPKPQKKKFVQHSIFLPVIQTKQKTQRDNQYRSERHQLRSRQDTKFNEVTEDEQRQKSDQEQQSTMEYLNECERIIENLKKLTTISTNKLQRKKPRLYSRNESNQRIGNNTLNVNELQENQNDKNYRKSRNKAHTRDNQQYSHQREIKSSFDQRQNGQIQEKNKPNKNSSVKINEKKIQPNSNNNEVAATEQEMKRQQELRKAQRKQKFLMKFLNKAKDRGCELHKKIAQFRMKKSEQRQSQVEPSEASPTKPTQPNQQSSKKLKKANNQQKNPENLSPLKPDPKKLPDLKKPQESPTKIKKN